MKNLKLSGTILSKAEQKSINGGKYACGQGFYCPEGWCCPANPEGPIQVGCVRCV